jgi:hypothetical protein
MALAKKVIKLLGEPIQNEDYMAAEAITPGHAVDLNSAGNLIKQATAGGNRPRWFALEREEMGQGIDVAYASGDYVKMGAFYPGMRVLAFAASGQNLTKGDRLTYAADGTLKAVGGDTPVARILETTGALTALTRIRCEVM